MMSSAMTSNGQVAHGEIDPYGVVLAVDAVRDVVEQPADGWVLQGQGWGQATSDQSRPHLPDTVPVPCTGWIGTAEQTQQAVQSTLKPTQGKDP